MLLRQYGSTALPLTLGIDEGLGIGSLWSGAASGIRGRSHLCFIDMASRSTLKETLGLIRSYSDILDMVVENRELSLDVGGTNSKASKPFGSIELGDSKREYGFGSDRTCEPDSLLGLCDGLFQHTIQIQGLGGPGNEKGKLVLVQDASSQNRASSDSTSLAAS